MASASLTGPSDAFTLRIAYLDYYVAPRVPRHDGEPGLRGVHAPAPVVRVFGPTPSGQTACLHLHGVRGRRRSGNDPAWLTHRAVQFYPYFFVDPTAHHGFPVQGSRTQIAEWLFNFQSALSRAINESLPGRGGGAKGSQQVHSVGLLAGRPYFGYSSGDRPFVRVQLYSPRMVTRAAAALRAGQVLGTSFQPHESHIPYLLHLFLDFNLKGMGDLRVANAVFRLPLPERALDRRNLYREMPHVVARASAAYRVYAGAARQQQQQQQQQQPGQAQQQQGDATLARTVAAMEAGQRAEAAAPLATQEAAVTGSAASISAAWTTHTVPAHMQGPIASAGGGQAALGTLGTAVRGMLVGTGGGDKDKDKAEGRPEHAPAGNQPPAGHGADEERGCRTLFVAAPYHPQPPALTPLRDRYPRRQSSCALELDASVWDVLNASEGTQSTQSLLQAGAEARPGGHDKLPAMDAVRSLAEIWQEEVRHCLDAGGTASAVLPPREASQRGPIPDSETQRQLRAKLDAVVQRMAAEARQGGLGAPTAARALADALPFAQMTAERARLMEQGAVEEGSGRRASLWLPSAAATAAGRMTSPRRPTERLAPALPAHPSPGRGTVARPTRSTRSAEGQREEGDLLDLVHTASHSAAGASGGDSTGADAEEGAAVLGPAVWEGAREGAEEDRDLEMVMRLVRNMSEESAVPATPTGPRGERFTEGGRHAASGSASRLGSVAELDMGEELTLAWGGRFRRRGSLQGLHIGSQEEEEEGEGRRSTPRRPRRPRAASGSESGTATTRGDDSPAAKPVDEEENEGNDGGVESEGEEEEEEEEDEAVQLPWSQAEFAPSTLHKHSQPGLTSPSTAGRRPVVSRRSLSAAAVSTTPVRTLARARSSEWDDIAASQRDEWESEAAEALARGPTRGGVAWMDTVPSPQKGQEKGVPPQSGKPTTSQRGPTAVLEEEEEEEVEQGDDNSGRQHSQHVVLAPSRAETQPVTEGEARERVTGLHEEAGAAPPAPAAGEVTGGRECGVSEEEEEDGPGAIEEDEGPEAMEEEGEAARTEASGRQEHPVLSEDDEPASGAATPLSQLSSLGWDLIEEIERGVEAARQREAHADDSRSVPPAAAPPTDVRGGEALGEPPSLGAAAEEEEASAAAAGANNVGPRPPTPPSSRAPPVEEAARGTEDLDVDLSPPPPPRRDATFSRPGGDGDHVTEPAPQRRPTAPHDYSRWREALRAVRAKAAVQRPMEPVDTPLHAIALALHGDTHQGAQPSAMWLQPRVAPPTAARLADTWTAYGLPQTGPSERGVFYGREADVPSRPVEFAGKTYHLPGPGVKHLEAFDTAPLRALVLAARFALSADSGASFTDAQRSALLHAEPRASAPLLSYSAVVATPAAAASCGLPAHGQADTGADLHRWAPRPSPAAVTRAGEVLEAAPCPEESALFGDAASAAIAELRRRSAAQRGAGVARRDPLLHTLQGDPPAVWLVPSIPPPPHPSTLRGNAPGGTLRAAPAPRSRPPASSLAVSLPSAEADTCMTTKQLGDQTSTRAQRARAAGRATALPDPGQGAGADAGRGKRSAPDPDPIPLSSSAASSASASASRPMAAAHELLTVLSIEVLGASRGGLRPDPSHDPVMAVCYEVQEGDTICFTGVLTWSRHSRAPLGLGSRVWVDVVESERHLFLALAAAVEAIDPDFVVGYEVQRESLGYLCDRADKLDFPLAAALSRTPTGPQDSRHRNDSYGDTHGSGLWLVGRIILNLWRSMRHQLKLPAYSAEHVAWATLRKRIPLVPLPTLGRWAGASPRGLARALRYVLDRTRLNLDILRHVDFVQQTSEMARVYGVDFVSVVTRGSQFRVEAVMLRVSRPLNYVLPSPSPDQVGGQAAMECVPLLMEPVSSVYTDPVIVLDFQSLYPSVMIAYNMCYSTLLGRVDANDADGSIKGRIGFVPWEPPSDLPDIAPRSFTARNGVVFASRADREGVLPRMLRDILDTRVMVKHAMKREGGTESVRQRVRDARQMALKMIANVTYGYAGAGYSGRMPCAELADAIVATGRAALEAAIDMVEGDPDWAADVVYGDTDSLFVRLPGRTRQEAFRIGREIVDRVTRANPEPIKLKLEKVYMPCAMVSKKRYVGASYEDEKASVEFDAKGLETVRRDSCPLVAGTMERALRVLFRTRDMSQVKAAVVEACGKTLSGEVSLRECMFSKEVKLGRYRNPASLPPAAVVATRAMMADPRAEPRYKERVPYVVVHGTPGARLVDLVVAPEVAASPRSDLRLNGVYYVSRQVVPALARVLNLGGGDVEAWVRDMQRPHPQQRLGGGPRMWPGWAVYDPPRALAAAAPEPGAGAGAEDPVAEWVEALQRGDRIGARARVVPPGSDASEAQEAAPRRQRSTVDRFFLSRRCALCRAPSVGAFCDPCGHNVSRAAAVVETRGRVARRGLERARLHCRHCAGSLEAADACVNTDCDVFYRRQRLEEGAAMADQLVADVHRLAATRARQ